MSKNLFTGFLMACFFMACRNTPDTSVQVSIFNAVPNKSKPVIEVNGELTSLEAPYGNFQKNVEVEAGINEIKLISSNSGNNPVATFQDRIDPDKNTLIFFTERNEASARTGFAVSADSIPSSPAGSANLRFINSLSIPDTVTFLVRYNTSNPINELQFTKNPYAKASDFLKISFNGDSTLVRIDALAPREPSEGPVVLKTDFFWIREQQEITFVFFGNESVKNELSLVGFVEDSD